MSSIKAVVVLVCKRLRISHEETEIWLNYGRNKNLKRVQTIQHFVLIKHIHRKQIKLTFYRNQHGIKNRVHEMKECKVI
jgi:hypothetical protein